MSFYPFFLQILNSFIGKFQVCTVIRTWLLIYVPFADYVEQ